MKFSGRPGRHASVAGQLVWNREPSKLLEQLKVGINNRIIKKAITKGGAIVRKAVRQLSPVDKKVLKPSIGTKIYKKRGRPIVKAIVGARSKYQKIVGVRVRGKNKGQQIIRKPAHYLHLVDQGTKKLQARAFMTKAMTQSWPAAKDKMREVIEEEVVRYFK